MITLNLLPDVKKEYINSKRTKQLITLSAFGVAAVAIATTVLMAVYVSGVQRLQINNSQNSIDESIKILTEAEDLAKIVTVQNQLGALPQIEDETIAVNRLFNYLSIITPNDISLTQINIDYEDNAVEIRGSGTDFKAVNTYVDTIKNASYTYSGGETSVLAFSSVVLDSINNDDVAGFRVLFVFDPLIFDSNTEGVKLAVPSITSTRSQTEKPKSLFDSQEEGS